MLLLLLSVCADPFFLFSTLETSWHDISPSGKRCPAGVLFEAFWLFWIPLINLRALTSYSAWLSTTYRRPESAILIIGSLLKVCYCFMISNITVTDAACICRCLQRDVWVSISRCSISIDTTYRRPENTIMTWGMLSSCEPSTLVPKHWCCIFRASDYAHMSRHDILTSGKCCHYVCSPSYFFSGGLINSG